MAGTLLDKGLQELQEQIILLGSLVENALNQALHALQMDDQDESGLVIRGDQMIDALHLTLEERVFHLLVLQQPLGGRDLRYITSLLPITIDLERMGDDAEGIAQYILRLAPFRQTHKRSTSTDVESDQSPEGTLKRDILALGHDVRHMLRNTMQALVDRDTSAARSIWMQDVQIDRLASRINRNSMELLEGSQARAALEHDPHLLQRLTYLLWISYKLGRIADHCTNICERIVFIVEGQTDIRALPERE